MGGYGAGRLGFKYAAMFAGLSMLAGGPLDLEFEGARASTDRATRDMILENVHGGDLSYFQAVSPRTMAERFAARPEGRPLTVRVAVGEDDFTLQKNQDFHNHLVALGIDHEFEVVPAAGHSVPQLMTGLGTARWAFYREALAGQRVRS